MENKISSTKEPKDYLQFPLDILKIILVLSDLINRIKILLKTICLIVDLFSKQYGYSNNTEAISTKIHV